MSNFVKSTLLATIVAAAGGIATEANALNLTLFTDRASWETAAGSFSEEDFNSFSSDINLTNASVDIGPFTLSQTDLPGTTDIAGIDASAFGSFGLDRNLNGSTYVLGAANESGDGDIFSITFDVPITAFGWDYNSVDSDRLDVNGIDLPLPDFGDTPGTRAFFGFVNTDPDSFSTITFEGLDVGFGTDNYVFVSVPFEFESTLGLIALGGMFGGYAFNKKRKASKKLVA
jgi:hypothetical protein